MKIKKYSWVIWTWIRRLIAYIMVFDWKNYGFRWKVYTLLRLYICNRKQLVIINNQRSQETVWTHGVPQGSIVGPLLFLLYMNIVRVSISNNSCLYSDDTSTTIKGIICEELLYKKEGMQEIKRWFLSYKLELNVGKTKEISFSLMGDVASVEFLGLI